MIELPKYAAPLFKPYRYKVLKGGRGSAKSYTIAKILLLKGSESKRYILCAREFQNSMADSVHSLLKEQIETLGLSNFYAVNNDSIIGKNGTKFIFKGVWRNTNSIKSIPHLTDLWLEEAHTISKQSWDVLIPTIREEGSEVWVSYNPESEDDPTHVMFCGKNPPDDMLLIHANYRDNPWFSTVLRKEMEHMKRTNFDLYMHVWEGETRTNGDAQIFKNKWKVDTFEVQDSWDGPYFGADWGFSCLVGETKVKTSKGEKCLEDIRAGEFVLTRGGYKRVNAFLRQGIKKVYEVDCGLKDVIVATGDHRIYTASGWKRVDELRSEETVCVTKLSLMGKFINGILGAKSLIIDASTAEGKTQKHLSCTEKYGDQLTERFQRGTIFTTLTGISETTGLKTCYAYQQTGTHNFTTKKTLELYPKKRCQKLEKSMDIQKKTGLNDVLKLSKPLGDDGRNVLNVVKRSKLLTSIKSIATRIAEKSLIAGLLKKNILVKCARLNSWLHRIRQESHVLKTVPISCRELKEKREVFDLSVDTNHEFFANGLLVHNCDPTTLTKTYLDLENNILYIREEVGGVGIDMDDIPREFDKVSESRERVIRADNARPETISYIARKGFIIEACEKWKGSVEDGIEWMKTFDKIIIHSDCPQTAIEFRKYSYKVDRITGDITVHIVDAHNHYVDSVRYGLGPMIQAGRQGILAVL